MGQSHPGGYIIWLAFFCSCSEPGTDKSAPAFAGTGLQHGEAVWFAPDQDYGPKGSTFAPFFSVGKAATTNGTCILSRLSGAALLSISLIRRADRKGYILYISEVMTDYPGENEYAAASVRRPSNRPRREDRICLRVRGQSR